MCAYSDQPLANDICALAGDYSTRVGSQPRSPSGSVCFDENPPELADSYISTPLAALNASCKARQIQLMYERGCSVGCDGYYVAPPFDKFGHRIQGKSGLLTACNVSTSGIPAAVAAAAAADVAVVFLGHDWRTAMESLDRTTLALNAPQLPLLQAVHKTGTPTILVVIAGSAVELEIAKAHSDAIIIAGVPGETGGQAISRLLFGEFSPTGRLPLTYVKSVDQLPPIADMSMDTPPGRT